MFRHFKKIINKDKIINEIDKIDEKFTTPYEANHNLFQSIVDKAKELIEKYEPKGGGHGF